LRYGEPLPTSIELIYPTDETAEARLHTEEIDFWGAFCVSGTSSAPAGQHSASARIGVDRANALLTGHPALAASAWSTKAASSIPGTRPTVHERDLGDGGFPIDGSQGDRGIGPH
jgi:hypothetical protein